MGCVCMTGQLGKQSSEWRRTNLCVMQVAVVSLVHVGQGHVHHPPQKNNCNVARVQAVHKGRLPVRVVAIEIQVLRYKLTFYSKETLIPGLLHSIL